MIKLNVKRNTKTALLPTKSRETDEGWDIYADEDMIIPVNRTEMIDTGISAWVDNNHWLQIEGRSGLAAKHGLQPITGIIDVGYRGPIKVVLMNSGNNAYEVEKGHKIAQLVIREHIRSEVIEVDSTPNSDRNSAGFGSSGY